MPESDAGSLQLELTLSRAALPTSVGSKEAFTDFVTGNLGRQTSKGRLETVKADKNV